MILHRSDAAARDVEDIWFFIAQDSERAADRVIDRLQDAARRLSAFPRMGLAREDLAPGLRALRVDNFVIFYRLIDDTLSVERILHARLDVTQIVF